MISCEKGYIEIMEFPRGDKAILVDAKTGERQELFYGNTKDALIYELQDMETAVLTGQLEDMKLTFTKDVMDIMTELRKTWNLRYPDEEW